MTVVSWIAGRAAKLPPVHTRDVSVERDLTAKMPDGAALLADRWYPTTPPGGAGAGATAKPPPTVLLRSPYGRRQLGIVGRLFAERGYQVVIQSCRGTFGSGGDWVPLRNEEADGKATLDWVAAQPWFDGQLVTWGPSYLGLTQWSVAQDAPPFLKAMALDVTASNFRDAVVYPGGSFAHETALTWMHQVHHQELPLRRMLRAQFNTSRAVRDSSAVLPLSAADVAVIGQTAEFFQDWLTHETVGDVWWDTIHFGRRLEKIPPASLVGGWYDIFLPSQVADYEALRAAGRPARLTVGPWTHASVAGGAACIRDALEWYGEQLDTTGSRRPRAEVRVFVMGSGQWREFSQWPPAAERQQWYLGRGGTLSTTPPHSSAAADSAAVADCPDRFRYDPSDPTPAAGGPSLNARSAGRKDQRAREHRDDVLTYTSAVMTHDTTVIGPVTATLHLRSSLEHTDFFVRLCDVSPKGKSTNLADGIVRLSPGAGVVTKEADGTLRLEIALWPTANTFKEGHRIRVQVSSGAHPLFARNTGSGEPLGSAATLRPADQEVFHDSFVSLPVVRLFA